MKKFVLLLTALLVSVSLAMAQSRVVKGVVTPQKMESLLLGLLSSSKRIKPEVLQRISTGSFV